MSVKLRMMRIGRKAQPFYRIVAVDSRKKRDGAYIEKVGHYNPLTRPPQLEVDDEKALKWLNRGAIPSDTVRNLFSRRGVMMAFDLQKSGLKEEEIKDRVARFRFENEEKLKVAENAAIAAQAKKQKAAAPVAKAEPAISGWSGSVPLPPEKGVFSVLKSSPVLKSSYSFNALTLI